MSLYDYEYARHIILEDPPFHALIMAAMYKADNMNAEKLRTAFPSIWGELQQRYNAPRGLLPGERP